VNTVSPSDSAACECSVCSRQGRTIAIQVRQARVEAGLTQSQVARLAGIASNSTIGSIENGRSVSFDKLDRVSKVLGVALVFGVETEWGKHFKPRHGIKTIEGVAHGTLNSYTNYGCRCKRCRQAGTMQKRRLRQSMDCCEI
jgi:transcriptional regulator with XRE-family HTH domain